MAGRLWSVVVFTGLALVAFAANSVLARMALAAKAIDAGGYTILRLVSGAVVLAVMVAIRQRGGGVKSKGSWSGGLALFIYAICFSYAYISLETATGALILFGAVQITMILMTVVSGHRPGPGEWSGLVLAFAGFVYLVAPGVATPSAGGFVLMTLSGVSWGIYTLLGRGSVNPLADTAFNFLRTLPLVALVLVAAFGSIELSLKGALLAIMSGGIASGIGYALWYTALGGLTATQAAVLQLLVPVIAAFGGIVFVSEPISMRLVLASVAILTGILMVVLARHSHPPA